MNSVFADAAVAIGRSFELSMVVKAAAALMLGLMLAAIARRARASVRHLFLAAAFAGALALPAIAMLVPVVIVEMPRPLALSTVQPGNGAPDAAFHLRIDGNAGQVAGVDRGISMAWPDVLRIAWAAGAALLLLSFAIALWRLMGIAQYGVPWLEARALISRVTAEAGVLTRVDVVLHEHVAAPLTFGLLHPVVVFPAAARDWTESEIRQALLHELEHVRRGDWPIQLMARVACAIYWFNPLAWIAFRRLCLEAERACDDAVIERADCTEYAEQLVLLARQLRNAPPQPALAMARRSDLSARVSAVLDATQRRGRAGRPSVAVAVAAAAAVTFALAPVRAVHGSADVNVGEQRSRAGSGSRALFRAAERGDVDRITELVDAGANVNARLDGDGSPLIAAARAGHEEAVRLLLDRGADPNIAVAGDGNPLIMAASEGHTAIVELLIDRGASIDQVVPGDENALIGASGAGSLSVVQLLVSRGANVNARVWAERGPARRGEWRTPLSMALDGRHEAVAAFLRSSGARD